ncbi:hypothetical protein NKH41_21750 [Mesorhizobium sp. M1169]|uniref:hypothetical protein n=1 Tax=Mesorhizobium sp. M1169 TaxID=2957066 RepID=UPI003339C20E
MQKIRLNGSLRCIKRSVSMGAVLSGSILIYFLLVSQLCRNGCTDYTLTALLLPGHLAVIAGFALIVWRVVRYNPDLMFSPAIGFMVCCAVFFGFGNLSTILSDDSTQYFMALGLYHPGEAGQLRADVLTFFGATVLLTALNFGFSLRYGEFPKGRAASALPARVISLTFVLGGLALKYGVLIPARWGYVQWVVPGMLSNLAQVPDLGFFLMAFMAARGDRTMRWMFPFLWVPYLGLCLLEFSKTTVMFAVLMPALGTFLGKRSFKSLAIWLVFAGVLFSATQNVNLSSRKAVYSYSGIEDQAPLEQRVRIFFQSISEAGHDQATLVDLMSLPDQLWWVRLNYAGPQIRAMELYDAGMGTDWLVSPLAYLIPRVLWPDKPELVSPGQIFNRTVSRNDDTIGRVAITIFGEGYWLMGWAGVALISACTGLILGVLTRQSYFYMESKNFIYLPLVLVAYKMAVMDVLGFFQTNILGSLSIYIGFRVTVATLLFMLKGAR